MVSAAQWTQLHLTRVDTLRSLRQTPSFRATAHAKLAQAVAVTLLARFSETRTMCHFAEVPVEPSIAVALCQNRVANTVTRTHAVVATDWIGVRRLRRNVESGQNWNARFVIPVAAVSASPTTSTHACSAHAEPVFTAVIRTRLEKDCASGTCVPLSTVASPRSRIADAALATLMEASACGFSTARTAKAEQAVTLAIGAGSMAGTRLVRTHVLHGTVVAAPTWLAHTGAWIIAGSVPIATPWRAAIDT